MIITMMFGVSVANLMICDISLGYTFLFGQFVHGFYFTIDECLLPRCMEDMRIASGVGQDFEGAGNLQQLSLWIGESVAIASSSRKVT